MTVRTFIISSLAATIIGGAAWAATVTQLSPDAAGPIGLALLFLSLFILVAGIGSLLGYLVRRFFMPKQFPAYAVKTSIRQGVIVAVFLSLLLFLQLLRLYSWWIAVIVVAVFLSFELLFLSYDHAHHRSKAGNDS